MLRSIYRVASTGTSTSRDSFATMFHKGVLQVVRCSDDGCLEFFELELKESSIVINSRMLQLDNGGGDDAHGFAVHSFTQRLPQGVPLPVVGVLTSSLKDAGRFSLRIFGAGCRDGSLEDIASDCQEVMLDFVPTLLKDTLLPADVNDFYRGAFIVSGSCKSMRIVAHRISSGSFVLLPEASPIRSFPAFRAQVLCVDCRQMPNGAEFVSAFGCDDGAVVLTVGTSTEHRVQLDGPVTSVCLFSSLPRSVGRSQRQSLWADRPLLGWGRGGPSAAGGLAIDWGGLSGSSNTDAASKALSRLRADVGKPEASEMMLGCGGAVGFVVVFENVGRGLLNSPVVLARDEDTVLSIAAGDFDCDGREELLVGTFGGRLLVYGQDEHRAWKEKSKVEFGVPLHSFHALRSVDVVPYVLCGTPESLDVLGPPLRTLEAILQDRLDQIVAKYVNN